MARTNIIALALATALFGGCDPADVYNITVEGDEADVDIDVTVIEPEGDNADPVSETNTCEPFGTYYGAVEVFTASRPAVAFDTTMLSYPGDARNWFEISGDFFTAGGCGQGVTEKEIAINISGLRDVEFLTSVTATILINNHAMSVECTPEHNTTFDWSGYWCIVKLADRSNEFDVLPDTNGVPFQLTMNNLPAVPYGNAYTVTMYHKWVDIETGNGYVSGGGWPVIDSDSFVATPYQQYNYCDSTERRLADVDGDGYGDPTNYISVGVCEPWETGYVSWIEGRDDCDDNNANVYPGNGCE